MANSVTTDPGERDQAESNDTNALPDPDEVLYGYVVGLEDGEVTFTRPGIESQTFTVENGTITTNKERYNWLLRNVVGATAPTE